SVQGADAGAYAVVVSNLFGTVTSTVAMLTVGPGSVNIVGSPVLTNGVFDVVFAGLPNQTYAVDRVTNLQSPWELGYTYLTADTNGVFELIDANTPPLPARFYRVRYP